MHIGEKPSHEAVSRAMGNAALLRFWMRHGAHGSPGGNHSLRGKGRSRGTVTPISRTSREEKNKLGLRAAVSLIQVEGGGRLETVVYRKDRESLVTHY